MTLLRGFAICLIVLGWLDFLFIAIVLLPFDVTNCVGGISPVPTQGCGVIPNLVLFSWDSALTFFGLGAPLLGLAILGYDAISNHLHAVNREKAKDD